MLKIFTTRSVTEFMISPGKIPRVQSFLNISQILCKILGNDLIVSEIDEIL